VITGKILVRLMLHFVIDLRSLVSCSIARALMFTDSHFVARDLGLVDRDGLFMFLHVRFMFMNFGLNAVKGGEQLAVLDTPTAMVG
jgi:hypothetical protein